MCAETILYGFHRPIQLIPPCLKFISWKKEFMISKIVVFTDSCRYILDKGDQHDWNKLFGFFTESLEFIKTQLDSYGDTIRLWIK